MSKKKVNKQNSQNTKVNKYLANKVPFVHAFETLGMIESAPNVYTRAYEIKVPDTETKDEYNPAHIRECMKEILAQFVQQYTMQIVVKNSIVEKDQYLDKILLPEHRERDVNLFIEDYNNVIKDNIDIGHNNYKRTVYFIISTFQPSPDEALKEFEQVDLKVKEMFEKMYEFKAVPMTIDDRLYNLREFYNPDDTMSKREFIDMRESNRKTPVKHLIYPRAEFDVKHRSYMKIGSKYIRNLFINTLPSSVPDSVLNDLMSVSSNSTLSIVYEPLDTSFAESTAERLVETNTITKIVPIRDTVEDRKKHNTEKLIKKVKEGEFQYFQEEANKLFKKAEKDNESVMLASFIISLTANTKEELDRDTKLLKISASKYASQIRCCDLQQEAAYNSILPLGISHLNIYRAFTNGQLATIQPMDVQQLFNKQKAFLGLNEISDNLILLDRKTFPVGLICGIEHSGKTVQVKREIANTLMTTDDEVILISRFQDDYHRFANEIGGKELPYWNPDFFSGEHSYTKQMAFASFIYLKNELSKTISSNEERLQVDEAITKESEQLTQCQNWNSAVQMITKDKIKFSASLTALRGYRPDPSKDFDVVGGRFKIVNATTPIELICMMKSAYDYAKKAASKGKTVWIFIDGIDELFYSQATSDFLSMFAKDLSNLKMPLTFVVQNSVKVIANIEAKLEYRYFYKVINYFKFMSQGPIERQEYISQINIPESLISYITDREPGEGVIITPTVAVAFNDRFEEEGNPFYAHFFDKKTNS